MIRKRYLVPIVYIIFLMLPIYWLISMSFKTTNEILEQLLALSPRSSPSTATARSSPIPSWYGAYINSITYVAVNTVISVARGAACGLCLLALPLSRRQASVLLAFVEPHGTARRVRAALHPALFCGRPVRHAIWPWRSPTRCSTCRWPSGFSKASCPACRRSWTRPPMSMAIPSRDSS